MKQIIAAVLILITVKAYSDSQDRYQVIEVDYKQYCSRGCY